MAKPDRNVSTAPAVQRGRAGLLTFAGVAALALMWAAWPGHRPAMRPDVGQGRDRSAAPAVASVDRAVGQAGPGIQDPARAADRDLHRVEVPSACGQLTGIVRDEESDRPVAGARVRVRLALSSHVDESRVCRDLAETVADGQGRYAFALPELAEVPDLLLARAQIQVEADAHGYSGGRWNGGDALACREVGLILDCEVMPFSGLYGRVVGRDGAPVAGAWVLALDTLHDTEHLTETDRNGDYWLECDTPSELQFGAGHAAHGLSLVEAIRFEGGAQRLPDLSVERPVGVISGTVRFADGRPADGVHLMAQQPQRGDEPVDGASESPPHGRWLRRGLFATSSVVSTDAQGRFAFRLLGPGACEIAFHEGDHEIAMKAPFAPVTATTGRCDIEIVAGLARLDLDFRGADGWPLHEAHVSIRAWSGTAAGAAPGPLLAGQPRTEALRLGSIGGVEGLLAPDLRAAWVPWGCVVVCEARAPGFEPARTATQVPDGAGVLAVDVRLQPGDPR